jgi:hypothetical protein
MNLIFTHCSNSLARMAKRRAYRMTGGAVPPRLGSIPCRRQRMAGFLGPSLAPEILIKALQAGRSRLRRLLRAPEFLPRLRAGRAHGDKALLSGGHSVHSGSASRIRRSSIRGQCRSYPRSGPHRAQMRLPTGKRLPQAQLWMTSYPTPIRRNWWPARAMHKWRRVGAQYPLAGGSQRRAKAFGFSFMPTRTEPCAS